MIRSKIDGGWFCVIVHPTIDDPWWMMMMMMMMRVLVMELSRKNYKFITFKRSKDKEEGIRGRGHDRCLLARQVFSLNWFSWTMINFNYPCSFMLCFLLVACLLVISFSFSHGWQPFALYSPQKAYWLHQLWHTHRLSLKSLDQTKLWGCPKPLFGYVWSCGSAFLFLNFFFFNKILHFFNGLFLFGCSGKFCLWNYFRSE